MATQIHRLKAKQVENAKTPGLLADGGGLYLQVSSTASRSWVFRFKRNGRTRDMGLGSLDDVTLAKAREKAAKARQLCAEGKDPIEERDAQRAQERIEKARSVSFRHCAEQLVASHEAGWRNAKHRQQWRATLATYVYPVLGDLPVSEIDTDLVLAVLEPIWIAKTETASRVRGRIEAVLSWAKARGFRSGENPAQWRGHLKSLLPERFKVRRVVHLPALPYREMPAFMAKLRAREGTTPRALEFVILTASRTGEVRGAKFDEIDLEQRLWIVPGERMKAGLEHRVPLSPRAVAIVREMARFRINAYVFPGAKRDMPLSDMALLGLLRDLRRGITTHGFRSSFRDWAGEETAHGHDICEVALAHKRKDKAHAAYQRGDLLEKRRELMEKWAQYCEPKSRKRMMPPPREVEKAH
jgi:integrase